MGNYIKKEIGITLIALVITIIVMLILVTVTIRVATNGNLFTHAANAVKGTKTAIAGENDILNDNLDKSIEDIVAEQTNITYMAYEVGDTITIAGQDFYVIEDSDKYTDTVKILAALNVDTSTNRQSASAGAVAFDSTGTTNNYDYNNDGVPTIKVLVNSYVSSLGVTVQSRGLMLKSEAETLMSEHRDILRAADFWLGSRDENNLQNAWEIDGGKFRQLGYWFCFWPSSSNNYPKS